MLKTNIQEALKNVLKELGITDLEPIIERTSDMTHGDYATNLALVAGKKLGKNPRELAQQIAEGIRQPFNKVYSEHGRRAQGGRAESIGVEKVEIAGPGFINFWLSRGELSSKLNRLLSDGEKVVETEKSQHKKIMVEYGDANTHKFPHIGHLYSYIYGEAIVRSLEAVGVNVRRVCYQGDIGLHVAKCLWAFMREKPNEPASIDEKVLILQRMYQIGSQAFEDSQDSQEEIKRLNKSIYEKDQTIYDLYLKTRDWSIKYYDNFEKRLGIDYQRHYYESEVYEKGREIVQENLGKVFTKSEGAIVFEGSQHGLHDRVFVTQYGTPTYEAKDMYLQRLKMIDWPMDLSVITTASEQNGYFTVVFKALEELDPIYKGKLKHLGFGMVNLKSGKMSSRTGEIIGAENLIDMTVSKVKEIIRSREDLSTEEIEQIAHVVGLAAIKYSFLKSNYMQDIQFALEESISIEGNSGPYLQYTYARTQSVLRKAAQESYKLQVISYKLEEEEETLLRLLYFFDGAVAEAAERYSPNILCTYLFSLAQQFNLFYQKLPILKADEETRDFRLTLNKSVGNTIKKGLYLLGIEAPEKM